MPENGVEQHELYRRRPGVLKLKVALFIIVALLLSMSVSAASWTYWRENTTTLWVKFNVSANTPTTFTIDTTSSYAPDGDNTFLLFDDFSGASLNTSKWTADGAASFTTSQSGGILTFHSTANGYKEIRNTYNFSPSGWELALEANVSIPSTSLGGHYFGFTGTNTTTLNLPYFMMGYTWDHTTGVRYLGSTQTATTFSKSNSYDRLTLEEIKLGSNYQYSWMRPGTVIVSVNDTNFYPAFVWIGYLYDNNKNFYYDWVAVRRLGDAGQPKPNISCSGNVCQVNSTVDLVNVTYAFTTTTTTGNVEVTTSAAANPCDCPASGDWYVGGCTLATCTASPTGSNMVLNGTATIPNGVTITGFHPVFNYSTSILKVAGVFK